MPRQRQLTKLVQLAYEQSSCSFAQWSWPNHVIKVAKYAEELAVRFEANVDLAVAGALLHDFGDVFVERNHQSHQEVTNREGAKLMKQAGYSEKEIDEVLKVIIPPHSCKDGQVPKTMESKVLATADALAHLQTDFYLQFAWMNLPELATNFEEYRSWAQSKIERDFQTKIQFEEVKDEVKPRYLALFLLFND